MVLPLSNICLVSRTPALRGSVYADNASVARLNVDITQPSFILKGLSTSRKGDLTAS